ncbi:type II secretion system protein GspN [Pendulispora brunnea]|uniref:Type II secretion system protein GspN n=1 Tax=Pendulispora brunnea TaxID=2905690 RepID=A0ABZ2KI06_9BACT
MSPSTSGTSGETSPTKSAGKASLRQRISTFIPPALLKDEWKERFQKWTPRIGIPLFYLTCLLIFASVTFPYDKLKDKLVASFNASQKPGAGQQELHIDEMTSSFVTGVKMKGVRLLSLATEPGKPPVELKIDQAKARISVLPLIIGHRNVSFHLDAFGGEVDGVFEEAGKDRHVNVEISAVDLKAIEPLAAALGLPVEGKLTGTVDLFMPEGKAVKGSGTVNLAASEVAVGDGVAKIKAGMLPITPPKVAVGDLSFVAEAKEGILRVTKLAASGKDVDLSGDGRVQMREMATESVCDLNVKFKISDGFRGKNDMAKSLFGPPGSSSGALIEMDPKVKQAKTSDGFYAFHVRGQLGRPDFEPRGGGGGGSTPPSGLSGSKGVTP